MQEINVIGHRGVRSIATENTKSAINKAIKSGVDAVEFDLRSSSDGVLVLCHNRNLKAVYGVDKNVDELTLKEIKSIKSQSGDSVPTLQEILDMKIKIPLMLDIKSSADAEEIYKVMSSSVNRSQQWYASTFYWDKARKLKELDPTIKISLASYLHPLRAIKFAKRINADAITIPVYLLNRTVHWRARRNGLRILVYQNYVPWILTTPWIVKMLKLAFPDVAIVSDRPDKIIPTLKP